jgi:hypothetical protein
MRVTDSNALPTPRQEPKDLTFYKDDIIEIISETNADWWTGKVNGRTGLFPSNYVEKLVHPVPPALANLNPSSPSNPQQIVVHVHNNQPQPEDSQPYVPYRGTHPQVQHEAERKDGKYTQLKSTMAHSAAGGLGFGAGTLLTPPPPPCSVSISKESTDRWVGNRRGDRRWTRPRHLLVIDTPPPPCRRPTYTRGMEIGPSPVIMLFVSLSYQERLLGRTGDS